MASFLKFIVFLFLMVFGLWSPLVSSDLTQPESLKVPVSDFVASINSTIDKVREVTSLVYQYKNHSGDFRLSNAISDCLNLLDLSTEALNWSLLTSQNPNGTDVSTGQLSSDLRTWLSSVLVNQDTCLEGFDGVDDNIKGVVEGGLIQIPSLITDILGNVHPLNDLKSSKDSHEILHSSSSSSSSSSWIEKKGRKLLAQYSDGIAADSVVAQDGTGDFSSINEAVESAPNYSPEPFVIYVKKGLYKEYVEVSRKKWNIILVGDGIDVTVISGSRNSVDGFKAYSSATFGVQGRGFIARDITFENTAGPEKRQAVAFLSDSDLSVLYRCAIRGYQDSLYAHTNRQFYKECIITGTIDFILGRAAAVFQNCQILARKGLPRQKNTITSQGRSSIGEQSGFSIQFSNISAEPDVFASLNSTRTYLGRPSKPYSTTAIMQSNISNAISPRGWLEWNKDFALETLFYGEYKNYGPGAALGNRVKWTGFHVITDPDVASNFTVAELIVGNSWLPWTGIKYVGGLDP